MNLEVGDWILEIRDSERVTGYDMILRCSESGVLLALYMAAYRVLWACYGIVNPRG